MYDKIGRKIKALATVSFLVGAITAFIAGVVLLVDEQIGLGLIIMLCGPVVAWVGSWLLYGFGEIIDKLCEIEQNTRGGQIRPTAKEENKAAEKARQEEIARTQREAAARAQREAAARAQREAAARAQREAATRAQKATAVKDYREYQEYAEQTSVKMSKEEAANKFFASVEYIDIVCPNCQEKLSFKKGTSEAACPYCDLQIQLEN